ncbi:MAG: hypothetical protein HUU02_02760 [Bacteroidetes bacterium]|nr:hypothetical protein [Bacteroidota bacterium]
MISIIIVDDNSRKVEKIVSAILNNSDIVRENISIAVDLTGARELLHNKYFDLLILDLYLPNREGDEIRKSAGAEFIRELKSSNSLYKPFHIIGLTEYSSIIDSEDEFFSKEIWRILKYDDTNNNWQKVLTTKLQYLVNSKKSLRDSHDNTYLFDLGIVTALRSPELESILALPANWIENNHSNDSTIFYTGIFSRGEKRLKVVVATTPQMGMTSAAVLSMKIISKYRPKYIINIGICAGVKDSGVNYGDILIADLTWDYNSGKLVSGELENSFLPDPKYIPLDSSIKERFIELSGNRKYLDDIQNSWMQKSGVAVRISVHVGPVASGSAVIQNKKIINRLQHQSRKVLGLEMETYGVYFASENCTRPKPIAFSIKSVCDFADDHKNDNYQLLASFTSSQYLYYFSLDYL